MKDNNHKHTKANNKHNLPPLELPLVQAAQNNTQSNNTRNNENSTTTKLYIYIQPQKQTH